MTPWRRLVTAAPDVLDARRHDDGGLRARSCRIRSRQPQAVVARHPDVAERHRRRRGRARAASASSAFAAVRDVVAAAGQPARHELAHAVLVVDDQHRRRAPDAGVGPSASTVAVHGLRHDRGSVSSRRAMRVRTCSTTAGSRTALTASSDRVAAAHDRVAEVEPLEPAIERAAAQTEHPRRGLLVAAARGRARAECARARRSTSRSLSATRRPRPARRHAPAGGRRRRRRPAC